MLDHQRNVFAPLAHWRHANLDDFQPVVEILAKLALLDHRFEILVGRRDYPHVHAQRLIAADALEHLLLQHA